MKAVARWLGWLLVAGMPGLTWGYAYTVWDPNATVVQNQSSGPAVVWQESTVDVTLNFGGEFDPSAEAAMAAWNALGGRLTLRRGYAPGDPCTSVDRVNNAGWHTDGLMCSGAAFGDALAVTERQYQQAGRGQPWYIVDVGVVFDQTRTWTPRSPGPITTDAQGRPLHDFYRVMLHELGHVLGLDHPDDSGQQVQAIMNSHTSDLDTLQSDDIQGYAALYAGAQGTLPVSSGGGSGGGGALGWSLLALGWWRITRALSNSRGN